ncbi:MAG: PqqD family peptide modification chaperone [Candidatus Aminicenantes bacterium]|nr:PqqD family peptide modification chaperone [Candidatus Aminicenantes bacterium]
MKKRGAEKSKVNLLDLIPVRNIKWEKKEDGLIVLLKPKFELALLRKHVLPRLKKPYFKIKLDHVGSFTWEHCDGVLRVKEIANNLKNKFGDDVEPLYDRLALFLQSLEKNHFIFYKKEEK